MPQEKPQRHTQCLINGTDDLVPLKGYERYELVRSKSSKLVFTAKIPTAAELSDHYNNYSRSGAISEITVKRYQQLLDGMEPYRKLGRILDVGCGNGNFLVEAQKKGWEVWGTEYTQEVADIPESKGVKMKVGPLNSSSFGEVQFDIVTSFEVIEHINNPLQEVQHIYQLVRKGGLFYFTTPNFNALEREYKKVDYPVISYPEHLLYFTPASIDYLLKKVGFKKKRLLTTGIKISTFQSRQHFDREKREGGVKVSDEKLRQTFESKPWLIAVKNLIDFGLSVLRLGNSLKGYYIK